MNLATDRLNGIAVFVQAAEAGSFALAGERLGLSRSAVGKSIARLEDRLGVRLFHRTTRTQSLTEDGQTFHERCVRALAELEAAQEALDSGRHAPVGRLRVTMPVLFGRLCVAPLLVELAQQHAGLSLDLSFTDRPTDLIEDGFDLAIRIGNLPDSADLVARCLGRDTMVLCASPAYLARYGRPHSIDDIAQHQCLLYSRSGQAKPWRFVDAEGRVTLAPVSSRIQMDDLDSLVQAAVAGAGLVASTWWLVRDRLKSGQLERLLPHETIVNHGVYAVWPRRRQLPCRMRTVIDMLAERVPPMLEVPEAEPVKPAVRRRRR